MQADNDNLNEPKPNRLMGWGSAAVGLLLLLVICFANALCHPRARFMRELKQIKRGDSPTAVLERLKTVGVLNAIGEFPTNTSRATVIGHCQILSHPPGRWQVFCPEFPFVEKLQRSKLGSPKLAQSSMLIVDFRFEDGKAVGYATAGTVTPFPP